MAKSNVKEALQVAFNWMLPKCRPKLKSCYDDLTAANLKVAISVAYSIMSRYPYIIESYPSLFIYNSWRHICRIMREYDLSIGDHIQRAIIYGWVNGCCNLQKPMSIHEGKCFRLREKPSNPDKTGEVNLDISVERLRLKVVSSEKRNCYWAFVYYDKTMAGAFRFECFERSRNFVRNLKTLMDAGGLFCLEGIRHFYSVNKLFNELSEMKDVYEVNMPPEVYLMNVPDPTLVEDWEKGGLSMVYEEETCKIRPTLPEIIDDMFDYIGEIGIYGLTHLLSSKFDKHTAIILTEYTKEFWKNEKYSKISLRFLIEKNCSKQFRFYIKRNWQGKRYCNDISHLLKLSGYPRLWYFEKEMPATKICQGYMLSCVYKERNHSVLIKEGRKSYDYQKDKKKRTKAILEDKKDHINYAYSEKHNFDKCKLKNYKLRVANTNPFSTKDKVYNALYKKRNEIEKLSSIGKKTPDVVEESLKNKEKIEKKLSYSEMVSHSLPEACEVLIKNDRNKVLLPLVRNSLQDCLRFRRELSMKLGVVTDESKNYVPNPWEKPKKIFRIKMDLGKQKLEVTSDNVFEILTNYEKECKEKIVEMDVAFLDNDEVTIDDLVDTVKADSMITRSKLHKKKRIEKEWKEPEKKKRMDFDKRGDPCKFETKDTKAWRKAFNQRKDEIMKDSKKGLVSNRVKIENHYRQFKCIKIKAVRKSRLITEALKKIKPRIFHFIKFPKMIISGKYDPVSSCSKPKPNQLYLENPSLYKGVKTGIVTYNHWAGEVTLDSSLGQEDGMGGLVYFDSNYVVRYYHNEEGELFRLNEKGDFANIKKNAVQKKISILRKRLNIEEVSWRMKANEYGVHGRNAYDEHQGLPFWS